MEYETSQPRYGGSWPVETRERPKTDDATMGNGVVTSHEHAETFLSMNSTIRQRSTERHIVFLGLSLRLQQYRKWIGISNHLSLKGTQTCTPEYKYSENYTPVQPKAGFSITNHSSVIRASSILTHQLPVNTGHSRTIPRSQIEQDEAAMKFMLSSFLTIGGGNNKFFEPDASFAPSLPSRRESKPCIMQSHTTSVSTKKRKSYLACQRFIGRPMTRAEAIKKLESCKNFRDMVASEGDVIQNAIGLEYGSRLRSCVERSKRVLYHHGNRAHY